RRHEDWLLGRSNRSQEQGIRNLAGWDFESPHIEPLEHRDTRRIEGRGHELDASLDAALRDPCVAFLVELEALEHGELALSFTGSRCLVSSLLRRPRGKLAC